MSSEIIVNAGREETRVAFLENSLVTEIYIDRKKDRGVAGNVYKGRVMKVLPGMQAAFVDIGLRSQLSFTWEMCLTARRNIPP